MKESLPAEKSELDNYIIDEVIGLGGSSLVFSAYVCTVKQEFDVSLKVALKISTNKPLATQEVEALVRVNQLSSFGNLHNAFLVGHSDLFQAIGKKLALVEEYLGQPLFPKELGPFPVIVLNYISGERIISRRPWEPEEPVGKNEWIIEGFSGSYIESLTPAFNERSLKERAVVFGNIVKAIAVHHKGGSPHGDLHPGNIRWIVESDEVNIIDLGMKGNFGSPGWSSPEHQKLREGKTGSLPLASDIYVLGLWIKRLFPFGPPYSWLTKRCTQKSPEKRPTANTLNKEVQAWAQPTVYKRLFWTAITIIIVSAIVLFTLSEPELSRRFPENGSRFLKKASQRVVKERGQRLYIQDNLKTISDIDSEKYSKLRQNLIRSLAYYYGPFIREDEHFSGNVNDIRAVCIGPGSFPEKVMLLYNDHSATPSWTKLGNMVNDRQFLAGIEFRRSDVQRAPLDIVVILEDFGGNKSELTLPKFPYLWQKDPSQNMLFLYDSSAEDVVKMILRGENNYQYVAPKGFNSRLRGLIRFSDDQGLIRTMHRLMEGRLHFSNGTIRLSGISFEVVVWEYLYADFSNSNSREILNDLLKNSLLELDGDTSCLTNISYKSLIIRDSYWLDIARTYCLGDCSYEIFGNKFLVYPK